jgi:hypothetical protein
MSTGSTFEVGDDLTVGYVQPDGGVLVVSAEGDGAIVSCVALDGPCLVEGSLAEVSADELAEGARLLLPLMRQNSAARSPLLDPPGVLALDWELAEDEFKNALGVESIDRRIDGWVTWMSNTRDPVASNLADGTSVVSGFVSSGELVRVQVNGTVAQDELVAAMRVMISTLESTAKVPSATLPG